MTTRQIKLIPVKNLIKEENYRNEGIVSDLIKSLLTIGQKSEILVLPDEKDPDKYIIGNGHRRFRGLSIINDVLQKKDELTDEASAIIYSKKNKTDPETIQFIILNEENYKLFNLSMAKCIVDDDKEEFMQNRKLNQIIDNEMVEKSTYSLALALKELVKTHTRVEIAHKIGKSKSFVSDLCGLVIDDPAYDAMLSGKGFFTKNQDFVKIYFDANDALSDFIDIKDLLQVNGFGSEADSPSLLI